MDIDRKEQQGSGTGRSRVKFCLDQLEKAEKFSKGIGYDTSITERLTLEEMIGALVSAEQEFEGEVE